MNKTEKEVLRAKNSLITYPVLSYNKTRIAYILAEKSFQTKKKSEAFGKLYVYDFKNNKSKMLLNELIPLSFQPTWIGDNNIIYNRNEKELWLIDINTMENTKIAKGENSSWNPSTGEIACKDPETLVILDASYNKKHEIKLDNSINKLTWSKDGSYLAVALNQKYMGVKLIVFNSEWQKILIQSNISPNLLSGVSWYLMQ